jgi:hypothetical protein
MSKRNEPIGTVPCPMTGCTESCNVFRFRERGDSAKSIANRRFAGKLYGRCPKHGQFGGGAGDIDMQEYILCQMKAHGPAGDRPRRSGPENQNLQPGNAVSKSPPATPAKAKQTPAIESHSPAPAGDTWGFF